jgi:hypothetical protein
VSVQLDSFAPRASAFPVLVHDKTLVALNVEQGFTRFILFIYTRQFKGVEPNAAASALAYVYRDGADLDFHEFVEARWTFHK